MYTQSGFPRPDGSGSPGEVRAPVIIIVVIVVTVIMIVIVIVVIIIVSIIIVVIIIGEVRAPAGDQAHQAPQARPSGINKHMLLVLSLVVVV